MENQKKELQNYDIIFDVMHAMKLLNTDKLNESYDYIKTFFFRCKNEIFFYDGCKYELFNRTKAMELIPDDLVHVRKVIVGDKIEKTTTKLKYVFKF